MQSTKDGTVGISKPGMGRGNATTILIACTVKRKFVSWRSVLEVSLGARSSSRMHHFPNKDLELVPLRSDCSNHETTLGMICWWPGIECQRISMAQIPTTRHRALIWKDAWEMMKTGQNLGEGNCLEGLGKGGGQHDFVVGVLYWRSSKHSFVGLVVDSCRSFHSCYSC